MSSFCKSRFVKERRGLGRNKIILLASITLISVHNVANIFSSCYPYIM